MDIKTVIFTLYLTGMASPAFTWNIEKKTVTPDETLFIIKCEGDSKKVTIKQLHPEDTKRSYSKGWWLIEGGSNFNYSSIDSAVATACKKPE